MTDSLIQNLGLTAMYSSFSVTYVSSLNPDDVFILLDQDVPLPADSLYLSLLFFFELKLFKQLLGELFF